MTDEMSASLHGVHKHEVTVELHGGKSIHFETGKLAKQAHGSCIVRIGDNVVLATACANPTPVRASTFSPSPSITASTPTPRDASRAASSSAKGGPASAKF